MLPMLIYRENEYKISIFTGTKSTIMFTTTNSLSKFQYCKQISIESTMQTPSEVYNEIYSTTQAKPEKWKSKSIVARLWKDKGWWKIQS